jgi:hypothetical protein
MDKFLLRGSGVTVTSASTVYRLPKTLKDYYAKNKENTYATVKNHDPA